MSSDVSDYPRPHARLHLNAFFPFGPVYLWDEVDRPERYYEFDGFTRLAQAAERGLFTAVFLGDSQRLREHLGRITDTAVTGRPDQLVLFAHLAATTRRIGLVATFNTTYSDPVDLARRIATVDVFSQGRAGWNLVTTHNAWTGENFRRGGYLGHADRYRQALEYLHVTRRLWDGEAVEFSGDFYDVAAPALGARGPQGRPVLFQAGESDEGRDFAARHAEAVFSRYLEFDAALAFAGDLAGRLTALGRSRDDVKIFPGARIVLGDTAQDAQERAAWFDRRTWTDRRVRAVLESVWSQDLSGYDVDGPLPAGDPVVPEQTVTHGVVNSRDQPLATARRWRELASARGWSIRQLVAHLNQSQGFVGTPAAVADRLAHYVRSGAVDGLNLLANGVPEGFDDVVDRLVPALQERGVYPAEYAGTTLRENLRAGAVTPVRP
ncbi:LLM class flavin-dependent oxidoreductase [Kineosporia sp. J2-2]|uniref:LLM class flavin-dependent oxidoreductase n=1 Tax=Kineosporia corallincola TaxID=2835133 RepID=A0ABS5TBF7_9ACTN|nr:LLM class flavin-dependent oxidoreductase [Kineosporia corallincola]MBT0768173.1 LLM class flavin-dependent oxidoreductase [Kineosporia corallincola]